MRRAAMLVAASALCAPKAWANVPDAYGLGSRSTAMAGAVVADAVDFSATYYNPAGIVGAAGVEVSIGYQYNWQKLRVGGVDNAVGNVHGVVAGIIAPGELFGVPFAFGVAAHLPDDGLSFIQARRQGVPRWELYDQRAQLLYLAATLAIRPLPWLEIGGGVGFLSATTGTFGIRGRADILSPFDSALEHEVDADLTTVRFPQAGLRLSWEGWGALGVAYRGQSELDLQLDAHLQGIVEFAGIDVPLIYDLEAMTIASFTPQQLAVGLSFTRVADLSLNLDVTWVNWSAYESPTAKIAALLDVQPPEGTPLELPDAPAQPVIVSPGFRDRLVPRFGAEYRGLGLGPLRKLGDGERPLVEVPLRAGYAYEASPVPDQAGVDNLIDADRHTLTVGFGVVLNAPSEVLPGSAYLDVHGLLSILPERTTTKASPADFVGDYAADGNIFGFGSSLRVVF